VRLEKRRILTLLNNFNITIRSGKNTEAAEDDNFDITILSDGSIDVLGTIIAKYAESIPIKFNKVSGDFWAPEKVKNSTNFPNEVGGSFLLYDGQLESRVGGPKFVGDRYDIRNCKNLKSLIGGPESVGENFYCTNSNIETLDGGPSMIGSSGKSFGQVSSTFDYGCSKNKLKSLKGCANIPISQFDCSYNNLENFEGGPKIVNWSYNFVCNDIRDFTGFPTYESSYIKFIGYRHRHMNGLTLKKNPVEEILNLIPNDLQIDHALENAERSKLIFRFIDLINENSVIRNGDTIMADRLIHSLGECGVNMDYDDFKFNNYELR
jgi:hypothetical protein